MSSVEMVPAGRRADGPSAPPPPHPVALVAAAEETPTAVALRRKVGGSWVEADRATVVAMVAAAARGLSDLGVGRGHRVAVFAGSSADWYVAALAAQCLGGVVVGIYPTSSAEQVRHIVEDAGASVLVAGDRHQVRTALEARREGAGRSPEVVAIEPSGLDPAELEEVTPWTALLAAATADTAFDELRRLTGELRPEHECAVVYTSGTTGPPKGVVHSYRSLAHVLTAVAPALGYGEGEEYLVHLPMSHTAEHTNALVAGTALRWCLSFGSTETVVSDLVAIRPTVLFAVPSVLEKVAAAHDLADRDPHEALRLAGLDRVRVLLSGGAPLPPDVASILRGAGLVVRNIYGMTEGGGIAATWGVEPTPGTVGRPLPGVDVRLAADGEVLVRSGGICCGYQGDRRGPAALTDDDGFLRTGDLGAWTADGELRLVGRKRDILITRGGKNIAPAPIEAALEAHPAVARAVVVGDDRPYLVALVEVATDVDPATARTVVEQHLRQVNATLSRPEQVKRFALLPSPLRSEDGLLTQTLKVRRDAVVARHRSLVEELYR